jgi:hypothetical protein
VVRPCLARDQGSRGGEVVEVEVEVGGEGAPVEGRREGEGAL